jgi:hypothetical protein
MAISAISSVATGNYQTGSQAGLRQTFLSIITSVRSGDLSGAQQAFATLSQLQSKGQAADPNSPFAKALSQIGQSLQNGDIAGAQQALASLGQQVHAHHQHESSNDAGVSSTASATTGAGSTAATSSTVGKIVDRTV